MWSSVLGTLPSFLHPAESALNVGGSGCVFLDKYLLSTSPAITAQRSPGHTQHRSGLLRLGLVAADGGDDCEGEHGDDEGVRGGGAWSFRKKLTGSDLVSTFSY